MPSPSPLSPKRSLLVLQIDYSTLLLLELLFHTPTSQLQHPYNEEGRSPYRVSVCKDPGPSLLFLFYRRNRLGGRPLGQQCTTT
jgi:hypothetical protein